ncbi:MAG: hypothetical protein IPH77_14820 [Ignavibacteria bacterium]|nr:hypothetical protein [Ignavibacteria bacterium]
MENDEYYYTFKKLMLKEIKYLSIDEIRHHTIKLLRYCMLKSESGDLKTADKFDKERFDIFAYLWIINIINQVYRLLCRWNYTEQ